MIEYLPRIDRFSVSGIVYRRLGVSNPHFASQVGHIHWFPILPLQLLSLHIRVYHSLFRFVSWSPRFFVCLFVSFFLWFVRSTGEDM